MTFSGIFLSKNICMTAKMKMSDDDISHLWSSGRARDAEKWRKTSSMEEKVFHHFSSSWVMKICLIFGHKSSILSRKKTFPFSPLVHTNFLPLSAPLQSTTVRQSFNGTEKREISSSLKNVELAHNRMASRQHEEDECGGRRRRNERETPSQKNIFRPSVETADTAVTARRRCRVEFSSWALAHFSLLQTWLRWKILSVISSSLCCCSFKMEHFLRFFPFCRHTTKVSATSRFKLSIFPLRRFSSNSSLLCARRVLLFHDGKIKQTNKHSKWKSIFTRSFCTEWERMKRSTESKGR